jgi:16S rRNA (uracil1498-N3)-methyltransferase
MRKDKGDELRIFNGKDGEWLAKIEELNKKNGIIKITKKLLDQKSSPDIWVLASPVKKEAFDLMIEKACELGAKTFIPVICEHTVVHKLNQERLQAVAVEAAEQSERLDVMTVQPITDLRKYLRSYTYDRKLMFCIERVTVPSLVETALRIAKKPLAVLIGPEGGFSPQELDFISTFDYVLPVSLGTRVLKSETALIAALAVITASQLVSSSE